jgi:protein-S-isoprenylcysteine O-methyltransferase Ste14
LQIAPTQAQAAARPGSKQAGRKAYWAGIRFLLFGRAVPAALFGAMTWIQFVKLTGSLRNLPPSPTMSLVTSHIVSPALYTAFCSIPVVLYLTRPRPKARDARRVAWMAAFAGTTVQLLVGTLLGSGPMLFNPPRALSEMGVALAVIAVTGAVWSLGTLRRSLSVIPEARRLVTRGPYRLVRHPLYLFEILAALAVLLGEPGAIATGTFAVLVALQVTRARMEENLLAATFPEYSTFRRSTRYRLIPRVW